MVLEWRLTTPGDSLGSLEQPTKRRLADGRADRRADGSQKTLQNSPPGFECEPRPSAANQIEFRSYVSVHGRFHVRLAYRDIERGASVDRHKRHLRPSQLFGFCWVVAIAISVTLDGDPTLVDRYHLRGFDGTVGQLRNEQSSKYARRSDWLPVPSPRRR